MTLTEEQREAIHAVSGLLTAIGCPQCHSYLQKNYTHHIEVLRAMVDSSGTVGPSGGFDLEKARDALDEPICPAGQHRVVLELQGALAEIERLRGYETAARDLSCDLTKIAIERDELRDCIQELEAVLKEADQYRRSSLNHVMQIANQRDEAEARIKELESSLDEAEALTKKNADLMNIYLARIAELEDALVEGLTNFLHYRASCYDPARRCPYAKECDDCSTWDACGHVEKFRSEARQLLQADGKIGPGTVAPPCWKITEERKAALNSILEYISYDSHDDIEICGHADILRAMLEGAE